MAPAWNRPLVPFQMCFKKRCFNGLFFSLDVRSSGSSPYCFLVPASVHFASPFLISENIARLQMIPYVPVFLRLCVCVCVFNYVCLILCAAPLEDTAKRLKVAEPKESKLVNWQKLGGAPGTRYTFPEWRSSTLTKILGH